VLAAELGRLGAEDLRVGRRTVEFFGSTETLYRCVLESRTAVRVLEPLGRFAVRNEDELYAAVSSLAWPELLHPGDTLRIDAVIHDTFVNHSLYAAQLVKDAIVDRLREQASWRPDVQLRGATHRFALHLVGSTATLFRDAAGRSLHQRGWRPATRGLLPCRKCWRPAFWQWPAGGLPRRPPASCQRRCSTRCVARERL